LLLVQAAQPWARAAQSLLRTLASDETKIQSPKMPIAVAIVEDDERIRESLTVLIQGVEGFRCVGSHASAEEALRAVPAEKPDVVLMDINLPKMSGIECVGKLKAKLPKTQILMLTVYDDSDLVFKALTQGASGYIIKRTAPDRLMDAIRDAYQGGSPMSPHIARKVVQYFHQLGPGPHETESLTDREREVLEHLAKGYLYKEIADALGIGLETVRRHLSNIYGKLHVHTRTEAVVKLLQGHSPSTSKVIGKAS
jgi:DNA-binding NarL/FixJ family response regulator